MKGREDDNIETIRKRFKVFLESSLPVIQYYEAKGKVRKVKSYFLFDCIKVHRLYVVIKCCCTTYIQINAAKPIESVFEEVKAVFSPEAEKVKINSCAIL